MEERKKEEQNIEKEYTHDDYQNKTIQKKVNK